MRLLLISNSTNAGEAYLDYPKNNIREFLGSKKIKALFIPYAAVTFSYDDYEKKVRERFNEVGHDVISIHRFKDPVKAVMDAPAIVVGGGNTWMLLRCLREKKLIAPVRKKVLGGTPYIGWSAGSNVACPTIMTTNDMPVTTPSSFRAFGLIPFQINPHYLDANPAGHAGETREQRIEEFIEVNRDIYVAGLREGTMFLLEGRKLSLIGPRNARIFRYGSAPVEAAPGSDPGFLLKKRKK
ncbi:MAG: dipeptidase PepE [Bacteroidales bacterium]|jgi:dipeptidase E|nr:dipeptidase PepE [Bacteroidales bacterium]MDD3736029.1 dipeptidase PepE [Bacteroidales bacterium]HNT92463.1 dipeptidase PepE [Bacteroidales bacterium]HOO65678.1 dipeptidase PepE [Bacteroidales bacterium]HPE21651.1 dipeptidase PepE [Bacteroidales bacterium]